MKDLDCGQELATVGLSLYVLGFAIGPLIWAPLSEMYGRQSIFFVSFGLYTAFNCASAGSQNIWTLIILRFFAGSFGASPLTNAGGVIADLFPPAERGLAMGIFSAAPFMGPVRSIIIKYKHLLIIHRCLGLSLEDSSASRLVGDGFSASPEPSPV